MLTRICVALWLVVTSSASALPYQEKIIPLIAPLAGVTADKRLAYTDRISPIPYANGYKSPMVLQLVNLLKFSKRIYSVNGEKFHIKDVITESNIEKIEHYTYPTNLILLDVIGTQKITPNLLSSAIKSIDLYTNLYPIITQNKKYLLRATNYNIYITLVEQQINDPKAKYYKIIPTVDYQGDGDYDNNKSSIMINKKMNRIMVAGSNLELYKVDLLNLPKTYEGMRKNLIYGPAWSGYGDKVFIKIPDPKDIERKTFNAYQQYLSLSPDDNYVAAGYSDETKKYTGWVRSINTGLIRYLLTGDNVFSTAWSPNGKYLVTLGKYISIRNARTGKTIQTIGAKGSEIDRGPFFTKDGKLLFSDKNFNMHVVTLP